MNQILVFGFDQSSLLQNNARLVSVSTKIVQAGTDTQAKDREARIKANPGTGIFMVGVIVR
jgi:hypothetical protein